MYICVCACLSCILLYIYIYIILADTQWILWHNFSFFVHLSVSVLLSFSLACPLHDPLLHTQICFSLSSCCLSLFHLLFLSSPTVSALPLSDAWYSEQFVYSGLARQKKQKHENQACKMAMNYKTIQCHLL